MSLRLRLYGVSWRTFGYVAVLIYLIDLSLAALDGYVPGEDYPIYTEVPKGLSFTCQDKIPGYYADPETQCQVWHWCVPSIGGNVMYSFICAPGTVFNQRTRVCDWFFKVDCPNAQSYYGINEDLYKDEAGNFIVGKKTWSNNGRLRRKARKTRKLDNGTLIEDVTEASRGKNFVCEKKNCEGAFKGIMRRHKKKAKKLPVQEELES